MIKNVLELWHLEEIVNILASHAALSDYLLNLLMIYGPGKAPYDFVAENRPEGL